MSHVSRRCGIALISTLLGLLSTTDSLAAPGPEVRVVRVPDGGIQPQVVVDSKGTVHLLYYKGDGGAGGDAPGVPLVSLIAAYVDGEGRFTVMY